MDRDGYAEWIEEHVGDPVGLERIREQVQADEGLDEYDKMLLDGTIGGYLADQDRQQFGADHTADDAPEEM